jgi:hypothetical protein
MRNLFSRRNGGSECVFSLNAAKAKCTKLTIYTNLPTKPKLVGVIAFNTLFSWRHVCMSATCQDIRRPRLGRRRRGPRRLVQAARFVHTLETIVEAPMREDPAYRRAERAELRRFYAEVGISSESTDSRDSIWTDSEEDPDEQTTNTILPAIRRSSGNVTTF